MPLGESNQRLYSSGPVSRDMLDKLGTSGLAGIVLLLAGIALIAWFYPIVAAGLALVLAGIALVAKGLISSVMRSFGMF